MRDLLALAAFMLPWKMIRCNELSVERLHKLGTMAAMHAPHHSAVYVSQQLRSTELSRFDMQELATNCSLVRSDFQVLEEFKLWKHPVIKAWQDVPIASRKTLRS